MASNPGTSKYPGALDDFADPGTATYEDTSGYEHDKLHNQVHDAIEKGQVAWGTTAGTNVLKNFAAGNHPVRENTSHVFQDTIAGGTINSAVFGTPAVTGGTASSMTLDAPSMKGNIDGWVNPNETWTYASASTFTVVGDVTTKYTKGTRLKWTQTTVKYGVVVASSYSSPNTTVTIAVNTDYTIANAAISANYYSYAANPQGYPTFFAYTSTLNWTTATPTLARNIWRFRVTGSECLVFSELATADGAGATELTWTLPIMPKDTNGYYSLHAMEQVTVPGGALTAIPAIVDATTPSITVTAGIGTWTSGQACRYRVNGSYEI